MAHRANIDLVGSEGPKAQGDTHASHGLPPAPNRNPQYFAALSHGLPLGDPSQTV